MYINEQYAGLELTETVPFTRIGSGGEHASENCEAPVLREHSMGIYVNGILTMKVICTGQFLAELVLGRLLSEGIIRGVGDVEGIYICEYGEKARVILQQGSSGEGKPDGGSFGMGKPADPAGTGGRAGSYVETTPTCCTGNRVLNDYFVNSDAVAPVAPIAYRLSWVRQLADAFAKDTPLHAETGATHSCYLARGAQLLFQCEDIGRHNALDKAIGHALRHGIDLSGCMVYTSGRVPTDMAAKVIRAGIPILVTKAAVSEQAVRLAEEYALTLIRASKREGICLYAGREPEA